MTGPRNLLRIAVDARPLAVTKTGVETYLGQMIHHLVAGDANLTLRLLTDRPWQAPWDGDRCRSVTVPVRNQIPRFFSDGWILHDVPQALAADPVDVFFTALTKFPAGRTPSVVTVHDLGWRGIPKAYTLNERLRQYRWNWWAARRATRLVVVSEFTRADLTSWVPSCAARVRLIHEAVSPSWRRVEEPATLAAARGRVGIDGSFVLAVGTLSPKKNLEALMAGFTTLRLRGFARHQLVLVGKVGWKSDAILSAARGTQGVILAGYVEDEILRALYSAADLYVSAALYEGFGLPVLEAMACGTPVIAVKAGALPEVAGDAALFCEPTPSGLAKAMTQVLGDDGLRAELVARGTRRVAMFSWARAARDLASVLAEAAEGRNRGASR
jgi:glycosyltransferase involved in cell wall biosynthesis